MKSQRAERQGPQKPAPWPSREFGRSQPDQPHRRDQGWVDDEEHGFGNDEEGAIGSSRAGARPMREEYDIRFLLIWLLGVPSIVVLTWSLVSG